MPGQIHTDYLKCVAFIFAEYKPENEHYYVKEVFGTAFFVDVEIEGSNASVSYLVTCHHILKDARKLKAKLSLRVNSSPNTVEEFPLSEKHWRVSHGCD